MKKTVAIAGFLACATAFADVAAKDDFLRFDAALSLNQTLTVGEPLYVPAEGDEEAIDNRIVFALDSGSAPTVSFTGLPAGLTSEMDVNEAGDPICIISGTPTKLGVYTVKATAVNENGFKYSDYAIMTVSGQPTASGNITPTDFYCSYGEDVGDEPIDALFGISADVKSISLKGLPSGLSLAKETEDGDRSYFIKGAPKKAGVFVVTATVEFDDKTKETATSQVIVDPFSPDDLGVDLGGLENLSVGESLGEDGLTLGEYYEKTGPTAVSGLPSGLTLKKVTEDGATVYTVYGTPNKEGSFTITGKGAYYNDDDKLKTESFSRTIFVKSGEYKYVDAYVSENGTGSGSVAGAGVYAPLSKVTVTATADEGSVFAGWLDLGGDPIDIEGFDYRNGTCTFQLTADSPNVWQATFANAEEDVLSIDMEDTFTADNSGNVEIEIGVTTVSLPKVTVTGLPKGLTFNAATLTVSGALTTPGEYTFDVSVTNATNPEPVKKTISVKFPNITSEKIYGISPEMDAYVFVAGIAIDPIVPKTDEGYTLTVAGLPTGLKYAKGTGITGTPTKAGGFTVTLTAKKTGAPVETATIFILVKNVTVTLLKSAYDNPSATGTVTGAGSYAANKKVTIKATPAKGSVFVRWEQDGNLVSTSASYTFTTGSEDVTYEAIFCSTEEDAPYALWFGGESIAPGDEEEPLSVTYPAGVALSIPFEAWCMTSATIKASGLPAGLKVVQDKTTKEFSIAGVPTTASKIDAKTGEPIPSSVKITATSAAKTPSVFNIKMTITSEPTIVGTFNGIASELLMNNCEGDCGPEDYPAAAGSFTATVSAAGKITAKIVLESGTYSFSSNSWTEIEASGLYCVTIETKAGDSLSLSVDPKAGIDEMQISGVLCTAAGGMYTVMGQRDAVKATDTKALVTPLVKAAVGTYKLGTLTVKVAATGVVTFSGKYDGIAVSGSSTLVFNETKGDLGTSFSIPYVKVVAKKSVTSFWFGLEKDDESGSFILFDPLAIEVE